MTWPPGPTQLTPTLREKRGGSFATGISPRQATQPVNCAVSPPNS